MQLRTRLFLLTSWCVPLLLASSACSSGDDDSSQNDPFAGAGSGGSAGATSAAYDCSDCDTNAVCGTSSMDVTCTCRAGYTGPGTYCADVDECLAGTDDCNDNARCQNTDGAFTCICDTGYAGDGKTCTDIDECATGTDDCDANATCTNTQGGFTCACNPGYEGDGKSCPSCSAGYERSGEDCVDIDECALPNHCDPTAACTNMPGSYSCDACEPFYMGTTCLPCFGIDVPVISIGSNADQTVSFTTTEGDLYTSQCPDTNGPYYPWATIGEAFLAYTAAYDGDYDFTLTGLESSTHPYEEPVIAIVDATSCEELACMQTITQSDCMGFPAPPVSTLRVHLSEGQNVFFVVDSDDGVGSLTLAVYGCHDGYYRCGNGATCIPPERVCDNVVDCSWYAEVSACDPFCPGYDDSDERRPCGWICDGSLKADGFCDCGCGAPDPDCADTTSAVCERCTCAYSSCSSDIVHDCSLILSPDNTQCTL